MLAWLHSENSTYSNLRPLGSISLNIQEAPIVLTINVQCDRASVIWIAHRAIKVHEHFGSIRQVKVEHSGAKVHEWRSCVTHGHIFHFVREDSGIGRAQRTILDHR